MKKESSLGRHAGRQVDAACWEAVPHTHITWRRKIGDLCSYITRQKEEVANRHQTLQNRHTKTKEPLLIQIGSKKFQIVFTGLYYLMLISRAPYEACFLSRILPYQSDVPGSNPVVVHLSKKIPGLVKSHCTKTGMEPCQGRFFTKYIPRSISSGSSYASKH